MPAESAKSPRALLGTLAPVFIFLMLAALTGVVWHEEVATQRHLLQRHTDDVTFQGARRLEQFVDSRLTAASLFARRWATHEKQDYSRRRFEEFAQVFIAELKGVRAVQLVSPDLTRRWRVTRAARRDGDPPTPALRALLKESRRHSGAILSGPQHREGHLYHVAAVTLQRGSELLGYMLVELDTASLIDACLQQRIRAEFSFAVHDGVEPIYVQGDEAVAARRGGVTTFASATAPVANRTWTMVVAPLAARAEHHGGWRTSWPVPLLGLVLSVMLALLVHLLSRRMELYRAARDQAVHENEQRKQAEAELRASEARYRSIFDSASDGFLVMNGDGHIIDVNRAAAEMHGYSLTDLRGRPLRDLIAPSSSGQNVEVLRMLAERRPARLESQDRRKDGSTLDVEVRAAQLIYDGAAAVLAIVTDVTERRLALQRHALLARKVLVAQEEERARIARELHDELGQLLTALRLELDWVRKRGTTAGEDGRPVGFGSAFELVEKAAAELRRICRGLRPPLLDDLGVDPAVRLLVNEFKERTGIPVALAGHTEGDGAVPSELALCVYRIAQESLTNVSRHAGASKVQVQLSREGSELVLVVTDDGQGFDPEAGAGSGLAGMRERANLVNGNVSIASKQGQGTRVEFRAPVPASHGKEAR